MAQTRTASEGFAYHVYVVELDPLLCVQLGCLSRNGKPPVSVGQSAQPPEVRFPQHKESYKSSKYVRNYGTRLMPRLYRNVGPLATRADALVAEARLAEKLRRMGYCVFGGH